MRRISLVLALPTACTDGFDDKGSELVRAGDVDSHHREQTWQQQ